MPEGKERRTIHRASQIMYFSASLRLRPEDSAPKHEDDLYTRLLIARLSAIPIRLFFLLTKKGWVPWRLRRWVLSLPPPSMGEVASEASRRGLPLKSLRTFTSISQAALRLSTGPKSLTNSRLKAQMLTYVHRTLSYPLTSANSQKILLTLRNLLPCHFHL